jgi:hypothetical protein
MAARSSDYRSRRVAVLALSVAALVVMIWFLVMAN